MERDRARTSMSFGDRKARHRSLPSEYSHSSDESSAAFPPSIQQKARVPGLHGTSDLYSGCSLQTSILIKRLDR